MKNKKNHSLDWLVAARGYAMYGVFLGHLMVSYINDAHFKSLVGVGRFLEPMFVPFFAIMIGAFYQRGNKPFLAYAKLKFGQRMLPVYFYLLLVIPFYCVLPLPDKTPMDSLKWLPLYVLGIPLLSWASWFLVALFTSEMLYYFIQPYATNVKKTLLLALMCYSVAWLYNDNVFSFHPIVGMLGMVWMLQASLLFCAFFLVGKCVKPYLLRMSAWSNVQILGLGGLAAVLSTIGVMLNRFNQPPEGSFFRHFIGGEMIVISTGQYGNYFFFILSTLGASLALLCVARLLPVTQLMRRCGDYSLVLLGLNGIFLNVLNIRLTHYFSPSQDSIAWVMLYAVVISAISLLICLPIAMLLDKYFPQLTGRPMLKGPILPALYKAGGE